MKGRRSLYTYQRQNDFAVRVSLEAVGLLQTFSQDPMVVYLAIHG